jgi:hypothetical protein
MADEKLPTLMARHSWQQHHADDGPHTSDPRMTGKGTGSLHSGGSFLSQFRLESSFRRCTLDGNLRE